MAHRVREVWLLTGKKIQGDQFVTLPQGVFVRKRGEKQYHVIPQQAVASMLMESDSIEEADGIFEVKDGSSEDKNK